MPTVHIHWHHLNIANHIKKFGRWHLWWQDWITCSQPKHHDKSIDSELLCVGHTCVLDQAENMTRNWTFTYSMQLPNWYTLYANPNASRKWINCKTSLLHCVAIPETLYTDLETYKRPKEDCYEYNSRTDTIWNVAFTVARELFLESSPLQGYFLNGTTSPGMVQLSTDTGHWTGQDWLRSVLKVLVH